MRTPRVAAALVAIALVGLVGCGDDDPEVSETGEPPPSSTTAAPAGTASTTKAPASGDEAGASSSALVAALVESVHLMGDRTAAAVAGRADQVSAADAALDSAGTDLATAVGDDSGAFGQSWTTMVDQFRAYTGAAVAHDQAGMDAARSQLDQLATSDAFAGAGGRNLTDELDDFLDGTFTAIDATVGGDLTAAHQQLSEDTEQAEVLAAAMVEPSGGSSTTSTTQASSGGGSGDGSGDPTIDLTAEYAEHVLVAGALTDAVVHGRQAEVPATTIEVEANTEAIVGRVRAAFPGDADAFEALWRQHVDAYQTYATGAAAGDATAMDAARAPLDQFVDGVADMLERWTDGELTAEDATTELTTHVDGTLRVIDAQAAGDLPTAYQLAHEGVVHFAAFAERIAPMLGAAAAADQGAAGSSGS